MNRKIKILILVMIIIIMLVCQQIKADFVFGEPVNLGPNINSPSMDACPRISPDGLTLYFCSQRSGGLGGTDIWVTTRETTSAEWGTPTNLGSPVNSVYEEAFPELWNNGLTLYFASYRPGSYGWLDIYVTTRPTTDDPWGEPVNLGPVINDVTAQDGHSLSSDGLTMYFVSGANWPGTVGGYDLWVTTRPTVSDLWGMPVNLGPTVNSTAHDYTTDLSNDELLMFFQSLRPGGYGLTDLYVTRRRKTSDHFGPPVNLGPPVNTLASEGTPNISADGYTLYFHSDRSGTLGNWDIWQASVEPIVDLNSDGILDAADMCIVVDNWGTDEPLCDIGPMPWGDGVVDVEDLKVLAEHLFTYPGAVAHWKLDETEDDMAHESVSGADDVVMGSPLWQPEGGKVDGTLEFDGVDDCVISSCGPNPADGPFSVFGWVKGGTPGQVIICQPAGANWLMADAEGKLMTELTSSGRDSSPLQSQAAVTDGQWHLIGLVWDGSTRKLCVDGVVEAKDTESGLAASAGGLYIGVGKDFAPGSFFSGLIDDVRIYNRAVRP